MLQMMSSLVIPVLPSAPGPICPLQRGWLNNNNNNNNNNNCGYRNDENNKRRR